MLQKHLHLKKSNNLNYFEVFTEQSSVSEQLTQIFRYPNGRGFMKKTEHDFMEAQRHEFFKSHEFWKKMFFSN